MRSGGSSAASAPRISTPTRAELPSTKYAGLKSSPVETKRTVEVRSSSLSAPKKEEEGRSLYMERMNAKKAEKS
jgi:hypothetical protein